MSNSRTYLLIAFLVAPLGFYLVGGRQAMGAMFIAEAAWLVLASWLS